MIKCGVQHVQGLVLVLPASAEGVDAIDSMTARERARLDVFRSYHAYVLALRGYALCQDHLEVRQSRAALARAIEAGCLLDPHLLEDFKRSFGPRSSRRPSRD